MRLGIQLLLAVAFQLLFYTPLATSAPNRILMRFGKRSMADVVLTNPSYSSGTTEEANSAELPDYQSLEQHPLRVLRAEPFLNGRLVSGFYVNQ